MLHGRVRNSIRNNEEVREESRSCKKHVPSPVSFLKLPTEDLARCFCVGVKRRLPGPASICLGERHRPGPEVLRSIKRPVRRRPVASRNRNVVSTSVSETLKRAKQQQSNSCATPRHTTPLATLPLLLARALRPGALKGSLHGMSLWPCLRVADSR